MRKSKLPDNSFYKKNMLPAVMLASCVFFSCTKVPEMTLEEIDAAISKSSDDFFTATVSKPWTENTNVRPGTVGGVWYDTIMGDPKTFNQLIGERDGQSSGIIEMTQDSLIDYDFVKGEWVPRLASFQLEPDEEKDILTVHFTIRDDVFWTYSNKDEKIPLTSDDFVWWYNEIEGDPQFQSSGYGSHFMAMADGSTGVIEMVKVDDKKFDIIFPRIIADPLLFSNCAPAPSFVYRPAKEAKGADGVKELFSIDTDPRNIPSCGKWYITEYTPSQRLVFTRNPNYWEKDSNGISIPYKEQFVAQIIGDGNTDFLLFKQGKLETYVPTPENVDDVISNQGNSYTVYNSEGGIGAPLWTFNQNPVNKNEPFYEWFSKKEFRQAMSCLLNRERIINQAYRGLGESKLDFFPKGNPFYNPEIILKYQFDIEKAKSLLASIGMKQDGDGILRDEKGRAVEYDLAIVSGSPVFSDIAQIITDECKKVGITVNVRQTDFQKLVEMLTATYDWQSLIISLGANLFPSQGSNVWPSNGNLHMWHPLQETPATEWEARVDYLYNEGKVTLDTEKAFAIWNEYQSLILEECPVIYLIRNRSFFAIRNKWNLSNFYYDSLNGAKTDFLYLEQ